MRIPGEQHTSLPWRIHDITRDFRLEDVWALPVHGDPSDMPRALELIGSLDPARSGSRAAAVLWTLRDLLGRLGLGRISDGTEPGRATLPIPGTAETSLAGRLPADLRGTADGVDLGSLPFEPLYRTADEFAAEVSNRTVHGVLHLAWVPRPGGPHQAHMAVYVKPRGPLGEAYMALIRPFRYLIVYPALMRQIERAWAAGP